nr:retrotransposon protein, putative, unclassified [Tanacetum cinerariifolium]
MVTRAKASIFKLLERMYCHVTTTSPLPRCHVHALRDSNWKKAMLDEYNALITNETWVLVPCPANVNVRIIASPHNEFAMKDLGSLNYFLESKLGSDGDPRILRYVRGTLNYGLQLHVSYTTQLTALKCILRDPHFTALKRILLDYGTDMSKITKKMPKPDKNEHEIMKSAQKPDLKTFLCTKENC